MKRTVWSSVGNSDDPPSCNSPIASNGWDAFQTGMTELQNTILTGCHDKAIGDRLDRLVDQHQNYVTALLATISRVSVRGAQDAAEWSLVAAFQMLVWAEAIRVAHYSKFRSWFCSPEEVAQKVVVKMLRRLLPHEEADRLAQDEALGRIRALVEWAAKLGNTDLSEGELERAERAACDLRVLIDLAANLRRSDLSEKKRKKFERKSNDLRVLVEWAAKLGNPDLSKGELERVERAACNLRVLIDLAAKLRRSDLSECTVSDDLEAMRAYPLIGIKMRKRKSWSLRSFDDVRKIVCSSVRNVIINDKRGSRVSLAADEVLERGCWAARKRPPKPVAGPASAWLAS